MSVIAQSLDRARAAGPLPALFAPRPPQSLASLTEATREALGSVYDRIEVEHHLREDHEGPETIHASELFAVVTELDAIVKLAVDAREMAGHLEAMCSR